MTEHERILAAIERIDKKLDTWIEKYEQVPLFPPRPTYDIDPDFGVSKCMSCGMEFKASTGYVCSTYECPMGYQVADKLRR